MEGHKIRGKFRKFLAESGTNQFGIQAGVLGGQHHVDDQSIPAPLHVPAFDEGNQIHLGKAGLGLLGLLAHHHALPAEQLLHGIFHAEGRAGLVGKGDDVVQMGQVLDGPLGLVTLVDDNTLGQSLVHALGHFVLPHSVQQAELQHLALAGKANGQRQGDGHKGMGIETLGVLDGNVGPEEGTLEGAHQVKMGNVPGPAGLGKQQTMLSHCTHLPQGTCWHRSRHSGCGNPVWSPIDSTVPAHATGTAG